MTEVRKQPELDARSLEDAARALALNARVSEMEARGYNGHHASEYAEEWWRSHLDRARAAILAFLEAERAQGRAMMPREPSVAMVEAENNMIGSVSGPYGDDRYYLRDDELRSIWSAMFDTFDTEVRKQAGDVS